MKCARVYSAKQHIDHVFSLTKDLPQEAEILAHWAKYLCVLVSGFFETSVAAIYIEYSKDKAVPYILNYVEARLLTLQNLNVQKTLDVVRSFNPAWVDELQLIISEEHKQAINSVLANRNKIAHGQYSGVTVAQMKQWYERIVEVIELIDSQCLLK